MSLLAAELVAVDNGLAVRFGTSTLALPERPNLDAWVGRPVVLGIRPEDIEDGAFDRDAPIDRRLRVPVELVALR